MSDKTEITKKTHPFIRYIGNRLGLVTQEEIQDFMKRASGIDQSNRPLQRSSSLIGQMIAPNMKIADYIKAYQGWVFSCVRVIAEETADIELTLYRRNGQNEFDIVDNHPVLDLLSKVNPLYTSYLLWEATQSYLELTGEVFWYLVGPTPNPKEIWILRPDWVKVIDAPGKLIDHYEYGPYGNKKINIPFENVIHFKDFNPNDWFRGFGTVRGSAKSVDEDEFQKDYSRNFFYNSALPAGALKTDQNLNDEEQYERIRNDWEATHRGTKNAWKIAILEAGLEWQDIGMTRKEMDFIEGRKLTRDEIMAMFRVPKPLLTFDDVNRAAAKEARAILLENVVTHKMARLCAFLNEFLLPRYGDEDLFFDYEDPVPNDETAKLALYQNALSNGWMTRNEVRELENRDPIEGGDKLLVPFSLQDIGASLPQDQQKAQRKRMDYEAKTNFNVRIPRYSFVRYKMDQTMTKIEGMVEGFLRLMIDKKKQNAEVIHKLSTGKAQEGEVVRVTGSDDERETHWKTIISRTDPRENKYRHLLTELFTAQQGKVNDKIDNDLQRSAGKVGKVKANIADIADVTGDDNVFVSTLMQFVKGVIESEGIQQIQSLVDGKSFFMAATEVQKYLKKDGAKFILTINEETSQQLRDTLAEGTKAGESIPQLKDRVSKVYEDARGYRAERIARSEVLRATNFATAQAYKQSGVVAKKEWLTAHDERTCPWCGPLDGKQLGLDDTYYEKGDTVTGTNGNGKKVYLQVNVADVGFPPLHPNCRCTLIPIVEGQESASFSKTKSVDKNQLLTELTNATLKEVKDSLTFGKKS